MRTFAQILIWLLVVLLGISFGAGLYESLVVLPIFRDSPPETWVNTGTAFWGFVTAAPLTLIALVSLFAVRRFVGPARRWWLMALCVVLVERAATFGYFIPTMISLQSEIGTSPEVVATLATWELLDYGRHGLTLAAWLLSLRALALLETSRATSSAVLDG